MKIELKFSSEGSEDTEALETVMKANDYKFALADILEEVRKLRKYGDLPATPSELIEKLHTDFWEIVNSYNLKM